MERDGFPPTSEADLRRLVNEHLLWAQGSTQRDAKPHPYDFERMLREAGVKLKRRADTQYPFPKRVVPPGHLPLLDVGELARMCVALLGLEDASDSLHPLWTVLDHLYEHDVDPSAELLASIEANEGGVLRFDTASAGVATQAGSAVVAQYVACGVLEEISEAEASNPARTVAVSPLRVLFKGALKKSDAELAAIGTGKVAAVAAAAVARGDAIAAAARQRLATGRLAARDVVDEVLVGERGELKPRLLFAGYKMGELMRPIHLRMVTWPVLLARFTPQCYQGTQDIAKQFYHVLLGAFARKCYVGRYGDKYYRHLRLSMGAVDSPGWACMLSAVLVLLARALGAGDLESFVDDFLECDATLAGLQETQRILSGVFAAVGIAESTAKAQIGQVVTKLGKVVDSVSEQVYLPPAKLFDYIVHVQVVRSLLNDAAPQVRSMVGRDSIETLLGRCGWLAECHFEARCHLGALSFAARKTSPPPATQVLATAILRDLDWFVAQWCAGGLRPTRVLHASVKVLRVAGQGPAETVGDTEDVQKRHNAARACSVLRSDAGKKAGGVIIGRKAFHRIWSEWERRQYPGYLELHTVRLALRALVRSGELRNKVVILLGDARVVTVILNKGRSRSRALNSILQEIYAMAREHSFSFVAGWLPREVNTDSDAFTNCDAGEARMLAEREGLQLEMLPECVAADRSSVDDTELSGDESDYAL